jgi:hypothetical protein
MIYQIIRIKTYSRQVYLLDQWIGIPFRGPDRGVKEDALGIGLLILIPLEHFPVVFLAFFWGVGLAVAFCLLARVFDALVSVEGLSMALSPGGWAVMGIAGIGMSPSKLGIGEMKLSKSCI